MRVASIAGLVAAFALTIGVQTTMAAAQPAQRTDPKAESPAGVIYQIPLDSARRDAAPVLPAGRKTGGGGSGAGGVSTNAPRASSNESGERELGPGTGDYQASSGTAVASGRHGEPDASSGAHSSGAGVSSAGNGNDPVANQGTAQDPSSIHSENGFGSASQVPGLSEAALRTGAGVASTQGAGSTAPTFLFIALIAAAAIGIGVLSTRHFRMRDAHMRDGQSPPRDI